MNASRVVACAGPLSSCTLAAESSALLVLLPGAMLEPRDYQDLVRTLQVQYYGVQQYTDEPLWRRRSICSHWYQEDIYV